MKNIIKIDTSLPTTPQQPYYWALYAEYKEAIVGCVANSVYGCFACQFNKMCECKERSQK